MDHTQQHGPDTAIHIDELVERCLGNLDFAERILTRFQHHFGEELGLLEQGLAAQDAEGIARVAHRMKGAAANAAAPALRDRAAQIERLGRAGRLSEIPATLAEMRDRWTDFAEEVASLELQAAAR